MPYTPLLKAGQPTKDIALQMGVTQRTIQRIAQEPPVEVAEEAEARRRRGLGRLLSRRRCADACGS